jgi:methyl-accepting chemotaxis protein
MVVGLSSFIIIAKLSSRRMFVLRLEQLERQGFFTVRSARTFLVRGFETAWDSSAIWSFIAGEVAVGYLSFLVSQRIMKPVKQMKQITKNFAEGDLSAPSSRKRNPRIKSISHQF